LPDQPRLTATLYPKRGAKAIPPRAAPPSPVSIAIGIDSDTGMIRIVDESGKDYLYPSSFFLTIHLPKEVRRAFAISS